MKAIIMLKDDLLIKIENLKRIGFSNKTTLIKKYLDLLDKNENDETLCFELYTSYLECGKFQIAFNFAELCKDKYVEVKKILDHIDENGRINLPFLNNSTKQQNAKGIIVTAASARFFPILLNLIGSIHKNSYESVKEIIVCDLGLEEFQKEYLEKIKLVTIVKSDYCKLFFQWKFPLIQKILSQTDYPILYIDSGCYVHKDLTQIFNYIDQNDYLITYNCPYDSPKHKLNKWTSKVVYDHFNLDKENDNSTATLATIIGISNKRKDIVDFIVANNTQYLLRPHSDCIDNRFDQSLSAICFIYKLKLDIQYFEDWYRDTLDCGSNDPFITIHRSKLKQDECYRYLLKKDNSNVKGLYS